MSTDEQELLARIGKLAGQINRYKNQKEGIGAVRSSYTPYQGSGRGAPYYNPRGRGNYYPAPRGRGRGTFHQNRTLVINNGTSSSSMNSSNVTPNSSPATTPQSTTPTTAPGGWVAKRDRHLQLINADVYEQTAKARAEAMAKTAEERLRRREEIEKQKLNRYLQNTGRDNSEVVIGDERFKLVAGGSKLVRISGRGPGDTQLEGQNLTGIGDNTQATPKKAVIGGVRFTRSKNGNLWRDQFIRNSRMKMPRPKINEPCKFFSTSGTCTRGSSCPFTHDPDQVAICPTFLATGDCPSGDVCDLSHELTPHRVPMCHHFVRGNCTNDNCRYAHVRVNPAAPVCRPFATLGYCPQGAQCSNKHLHECPDYEEHGVCNDPKCKLPHIDRAGKRRAAAAAAAAAAQSSDNSSPAGTNDQDEMERDDDEESIDSDVDSDTLSEFAWNPNKEVDGDAAMQLDFIKL